MIKGNAPSARSASCGIRQEVRPFTDKQIELVQNFAAQAVIAIENTRLLSELRSAPTISPSRWSSRPRPPRCSRSSAAPPGDLEPVFEAMLENAEPFCEADFGSLGMHDGDMWRPDAMHVFKLGR